MATSMCWKIRTANLDFYVHWKYPPKVHETKTLSDKDWEDVYTKWNTEGRFSGRSKVISDEATEMPEKMENNRKGK